MPRVGQKIQWETGVYWIFNTVNGKYYVGGAYSSFEARWESHRKDLRAGRRENSHLQNAWDKYGEEAFVFWVLERCHPSQVLVREQQWIDELDPTNPEMGYNAREIANSNLGLKMSDETKKKMSASQRQHWQGLSDERKKEIIEKRVAGVTVEGIKRRNAAAIGRVKSEETRKKLREANLGKLSPLKGKKMRTEEERTNLSTCQRELYKSSASEGVKRSLICKRTWADPIKRARRLAKLKATVAARKKRHA